MELSQEELSIIKLLREKQGYVKITVEKKPTHENPSGKVYRVVVEESHMINDFVKSKN